MDALEWIIATFIMAGEYVPDENEDLGEILRSPDVA
jgi:hypothetical protein